MFAWLAKPYPLPRTSAKAFLINAAISVFVAAFLIIFQPFGLSEYLLPGKNFVLAGYGLVCFAATSCCSILLLFLQNNAKLEQRWNIGFEIMWILFIIIAISFFNLVYSHFLRIVHFNLLSFAVYLVYTFAIGIFPVVLTISLKWQQLNFRTEKETNEINELITTKEKSIIKNNESFDDKLILLKSESSNDILKINADDLLSIESMDNYSAVYFLKESKIQKTLLRGSLKFMESQLTDFSRILRCHRTFIVNLNNVESATGNAQGYKLKLKNSDLIIPVSRNFLEKVLKQFKAISENA